MQGIALFERLDFSTLPADSKHVVVEFEIPDGATHEAIGQAWHALKQAGHDFMNRDSTASWYVILIAVR